MMKTIRDAINAGAKTVYCNNGTAINLPDIGIRKDYQYFPPKIIDGNPVYRWVFCNIQGDPEEIRKFCLCTGDRSYFRKSDYLIKERELNMFINSCGGINEYSTMYWVRDWYYDYHATFD